MTAIAEPKSLVGAFTREVFESHLIRCAHLPKWWLDRKRAAYERFAALPFPTAQAAELPEAPGSYV